MNNLHPTDEQLIEHSAGSLTTAISLCVSAHLACCETCRQQMAKLDTVAGVMFEQLTPEPVDSGLLNTIFARIDSQQTTRAANIDVKLQYAGTLPSTINKLTGYNPDTLEWSHHGRNVTSAKLIEIDGIKASLIRIRRGAKIPVHTHKGREITVVLEGSFSDADGIYRQGDFILRDSQHQHAPMATADADCICLVALDAPLKFNNPLMEIYNRIAPL